MTATKQRIGLVGAGLVAAAVPGVVVDDLDLAAAHPPFEVGHGVAQRVRGVGGAQRGGGDPHALLVAVEARLEVGDEGVDEVVGRLVELAEMRAPAHRAHRLDAAVHLLGHVVLFPGPRAAARRGRD